MTDASTRRLTRARDELTVVATLLRAGHGIQAVSRAYYAVFYAADAALVSIGQPRSRHGAVVAAFSQFVVRSGGFDPSIGRSLRELLEMRNAADYDFDQPPGPDLGDILTQATAFVDAVTEWLER